MADIITQLQDRLDQLNTQLYASLRYISTHHSTSPLPPSPLTNAPPHQQQEQHNNHISSSANLPSAAAAALPNGQPPALPTTTTTATATVQQSSPAPPPPPAEQQQQQQQDAQPSFKITDLDPEQRPDSPATFAAAQRELAQDLVIKTRQIEELVRGIVGVERGRGEQERRIGVLEGELQGAIGERERVEGERGEWVGRVEGLICSVRR